MDETRKPNWARLERDRHSKDEEAFGRIEALTAEVERLRRILREVGLHKESGASDEDRNG